MDGLTAPLPPSPFAPSSVTEAGQGSCWLNSFGVLWGRFLAHCLYFHPDNSECDAVPRIPRQRAFLTPEECFVLFK